MIKKISAALTVLFLTLGIFACQTKEVDLAEVNPEAGVYYEILVRSFADSDADGVGDFNGITAKMGYLQSLGIKGIWLMPIHPSPSYHGYDVTDYYAVNLDYGTMADFENMIAAADAAGIRVMLDMVFNHTSNQHPWFVAAQNGDATYLDYYVTVPKSTDTSRIFGSWSQNIWHTSDTFKYCGYFSHTMPDLNFYSDAVKTEIEDISKFWIDKGVKGFRLDAVHHYFGENEYLDETYDFYNNIIYLDAYSKAIDAYADDIYVIGEAFIESDYKIPSAYFYGLDAPLNFPLAAKIRSAAQKTKNYNYAENLEIWYDYYRGINPHFIDAPFIVNHDMDRFASHTLGNTAMMKLAAEMLLVLPGNPIIYYGEELGMFGVKAMGPDIWDETRRMPFIWGDDTQTDWITSSSQTLANMEAANDAIGTAAEQLADAASLLSLYTAILAVRNANMALAYGNSFSAWEDSASSLSGFYREYTYEDQTQRVLVIHNFDDEAAAIPDVAGTVLYLSGSDLSGVITEIPARSTLIIDVTPEAD
ncbi:MAG TPA: alpha-amylase [Acholeplasmatales bacterium]|nr:alpha-amylase [Acholeplasmatales bacterium]